MVKLNNVIVKMVVSDFFMWSGWGLVQPIFAIFIINEIKGGTIESIAFVTTIFFLTRAIFQPFLANILDVIKGEKDDFKALVLATYIIAIIPIGYLFATHIWHIFLFEFIRGIAMALVGPSWRAIYGRHINKGWEAFSWGVSGTGVDIGFGIAAAIGGIIASFMGFDILFIMVGILNIIAATILLSIFNKMFPKESIAPEVLTNWKKAK